MKRVIYSLYVDVPAEEHYGQSKQRNDTVAKAKITVNAFKKYKIRWEGEGLHEIGIDQNDITRVKINPKYYRPCEVDLLLGNAKKAEKELGW